ncbi:MAG: hypothetical protein A2170_14760 [Deltaproteobacteria bacterium RBG_13_53_10]|nr:MAG: hypothetical protein A2170_14760 [Deltaproteobacteria bacterium RBG_13_53_10]
MFATKSDDGLLAGIGSFIQTAKVRARYRTVPNPLAVIYRFEGKLEFRHPTETSGEPHLIH